MQDGGPVQTDKMMGQRNQAADHRTRRIWGHTAASHAPATPVGAHRYSGTSKEDKCLGDQQQCQQVHTRLQVCRKQGYESNGAGCNPVDHRERQSWLLVSTLGPIVGRVRHRYTVLKMKVKIQPEDTTT